MRHRQRPQRGFTLIEILVVIGIILLLVGLLTAGFRHVNAVAAKRETTAELKVCKAMLTEYENHAGLLAINTMYGVAPTGLLAGDMSDHSGTVRYTSGPVNNTRTAMQKFLLQVPANRTEVENLPTKRILESSSGTPAAISAGAVLLDGWGNPIILVPAAGLVVNISTSGTTQKYLIRTSGTTAYTSGDGPALTAADRPFFASAGQDGDFSIGEDNVYSFQE